MDPGMRMPTVSDGEELAKPPSKNTTNDMWVYTLNNPTEEEITRMKALHHIEKQVLYHVFGQEVAASGTPHLQGFVCFTNRKRFSTVKAILGNRHAIFTKAQRSTVAQASNYCKKGDQSHAEWKSMGIQGPHFGLNARVFEYGELPQDKAQGKRSDLDRGIN